MYLHLPHLSIIFWRLCFYAKISQVSWQKSVFWIVAASNFTHDCSYCHLWLQSLMATHLWLQSLTATPVTPVEQDLIQSPFFLVWFVIFQLFVKICFSRHPQRLFLPSPLFLSFKCLWFQLMVNLSRSMQTLFLAAFDSYEHWSWLRVCCRVRSLHRWLGLEGRGWRLSRGLIQRRFRETWAAWYCSPNSLWKILPHCLHSSFSRSRASSS